MYRRCVICKGITDDGIASPTVCFPCAEQLEKVLHDFNKRFPDNPATFDDVVHICTHDDKCRKIALVWI